MSNTIAHQRTSTKRYQKGGQPRGLSRGQRRELDRMSTAGLAPIVSVIRGEVRK